MTLFNGRVKRVKIHKSVEKALGELDVFTQGKIFESLTLIAKGVSLGMPLSRPMPSVASGVHELRVKDGSGQFRVFYFVKLRDSVLVFHFFKKKTQKSPHLELETAKRRLGEML